MQAYTLTHHSKGQLVIRQIPAALLRRTILNPQQVIRTSKNQMVFQSIHRFEEEQKDYLVRVVARADETQYLVITAYRTSKIINSGAMKIRYDKEVDVLTITLAKDAIVESDELRPGIVLDYDKDGQVVRIEVLDASLQDGDHIANFEYEPV